MGICKMAGAFIGTKVPFPLASATSSICVCSSSKEDEEKGEYNREKRKRANKTAATPKNMRQKVLSAETKIDSRTTSMRNKPLRCIIYISVQWECILK